MLLCPMISEKNVLRHRNVRSTDSDVPTLTERRIHVYLESINDNEVIHKFHARRRRETSFPVMDN